MSRRYKAAAQTLCGGFFAGKKTLVHKKFSLLRKKYYFFRVK